MRGPGMALSAEWVSVTVVIVVALVGVIFRLGHQSARIEELETWRRSMRVDMHEISDKLTLVGEELKQLATLIEERTYRRPSGGA